MHMHMYVHVYVLHAYEMYMYMHMYVPEKFILQNRNREKAITEHRECITFNPRRYVLVKVWMYS